MRIPINPRLPARFDSTPNDARPASHMKWWGRPFIQTFGPGNALGDLTGPAREQWYRAWPSGVRYDVRCLDGGAWDRPTCWGMFATLEDALACARGLAVGA
jgi:hypothetical protein